MKERRRTNAQMEAQDAFEAARIRLKLIKEGILSRLDADWKLSRPRRPAAEAPKQKTRDDQGIPRFDIPATRAFRHANGSGASSFHFAHAAIAKVSRPTSDGGIRNRPGAAKAHSRYVEREAAVAALDFDIGLKRDALGDTQIDETYSKPEATEQDAYLIRNTAIAIQPDGNRALITNIDPDDDERSKFWSLVEKHERNKTPDTMQISYAGYEAFWSAVAKDPKCPRDLKAKLNGDTAYSDEPFKVDNGKAIRKWLATQPGWLRNSNVKASDNQPFPMAKFKDGRAGRTQYRINFELPKELTPEQNFALVAEFAQEFARRNMPFCAVMHAPDEHNSDANWHAHLIYYDRPCRRIDLNDISSLARQGYDISPLQVGDWDFTVTLTDPKRANRLKTPLRQKKVAEVGSSKEWPGKLRKAMADVTNRHLESAQVERRVDARRFDEMGISAEPQAHLGSAQNAAETFGAVTKTGIENEQKQWRGIQAQTNQQIELKLSAIRTRRNRLAQNQGGSVNNQQQADAFEQHLTRAVMLWRDAFLLEQELHRARSRATMIQTRNRKLIDAAQKAKAEGDEIDVSKSRDLVEQATEYLRQLDLACADEERLIAKWRAEAKECEKAAYRIEVEIHSERDISKSPQVEQKPPAPSSARPQRVVPRSFGQEQSAGMPKVQPPATTLELPVEIATPLAAWRKQCVEIAALPQQQSTISSVTRARVERDRLAFVLAKKLASQPHVEPHIGSHEWHEIRRQAASHSRRLQGQHRAVSRGIEQGWGL